MDEEVDSGLLNISISDSDDASGSEARGAAVSRAERNAQSEAAFQQVKSEYRPKIENGEIWKTIRLPLGSSLAKSQVQQVLHAVEELYFFRRYDDAVSFVRSVLSEEGDPEGGLDDEAKELLRYYEVKCMEKAKTGSGV